MTVGGAAASAAPLGWVLMRYLATRIVPALRLS